MDLNALIISKIIDNWIDEDIGRGDLTSPSITEENGNAYWIAKEEGIFCGVEIIKEIFRKIDLKISPKFNISDGDKFVKDQKLLEIYGPSKSLLASERVSLNIAMHLSGISTYTKELVDKLEGTNIKLAFLPPCSPNLNLIEGVWKFFKKNVLYNKYYKNIKDFRKACIKFFKSFATYTEEISAIMNADFHIG